MKSFVASSLETCEPPVIRYTAQGTALRQDWQRKMIEDHLHLVRHVVERLKLFIPAHYETQDLISVGLTGLISAVMRYDPQKRETFAAYARVRIRGAIIDELRRQGWRTRRTTLKARQMQEMHDRLEQQLKRSPSLEELATAHQVSVSEYDRWVEETRAIYFVSYQHDTNPAREGESMDDVLVDENAPSPSEKLEKDDLIALLLKKMRQLPDIQAKVLSMYYIEEMRLAEIANVFQLTESRISQIHAQAIMALRSAMRKERTC